MNYTMTAIIKMNVALHMVLKNSEIIIIFQVIKQNYVKAFKKIKYVILELDVATDIS